MISAIGRGTQIALIGETPLMKTIRKARHYAGVAVSTLMLAASATAGAEQQQGATTQYGELNFGTRQYYPQGCTHNGNTAVCTFVFVQQAPTQPIHIGWGGELSGIQLVDDSHVPHNPSSAYFVDNYGAKQMNMTVNRGDQGTMMVEFAQVDPRVASCGFTLGQQALTNIPVSAGTGAGGATPAAAPPTLAAPNTLSAGTKTATSATQHLASAQQANPANPACSTPQTANSSACQFNSKVTNTESQVNGAVGAATGTATAVKSLMGLFSSPTQKPAQSQQQQQQQQ
jgi:hypothetical protein